MRGIKQNIRYDGRYFTLLVVSRLKSYSGAARELALTPSAVLQQIRSLESELGVILFEKDGKNLISTPECTVIARYADRIDSLCDRMSEELSNARSGLKRLVIGVTSSVESSSLTRLLTNYRTDSEEVQFTVVSDLAENLCEKLSSYVIDLAIIDGEAPRRDFNSIILDTDRLVVAVPPDSPYVEQGMITPDQLRTEKLILRPAGSGTRRLFEANLRSIGRSIDEFRIMMEVDSVSTIKRLVSCGYGISVLSGRACEKDVEKKTLCTVPLCDMNMARNVSIYYRTDFHNDALLQKIRVLYSGMVCTDD